jgi:hypothetical protein
MLYWIVEMVSFIKECWEVEGFVWENLLILYFLSDIEIIYKKLYDQGYWCIILCQQSKSIKKIKKIDTVCSMKINEYN